MFARRSFLAATLMTIAAGVVTMPKRAFAQGASADDPLPAGPATTGAPRTRGGARHASSPSAQAEEPSASRASGSPASRGRRRSVITEETIAGAIAPR